MNRKVTGRCCVQRCTQEAVTWVEMPMFPGGPKIGIGACAHHAKRSLQGHDVLKEAPIATVDGVEVLAKKVYPEPDPED